MNVPPRALFLLLIFVASFSAFDRTGIAYFSQTRISVAMLRIFTRTVALTELKRSALSIKAIIELRSHVLGFDERRTVVARLYPTLYPVSYTHLDVYKRQVKCR